MGIFKTIFITLVVVATSAALSDVDLSVSSPTIYSIKRHHTPFDRTRDCNGPSGKHSHYSCIEDTCKVVCNDGYSFKKGVCTARRCNPHRCRTHLPRHAQHVCSPSQRCTFACDAGYKKIGSHCVPKRRQVCEEPCDPLRNGTVTCRHNECTYSCIRGYDLYTIAGKRVCLNLSQDPHNCGALGNICPPQYNNPEPPKCHHGKCYHGSHGHSFLG